MRITFSGKPTKIDKATVRAALHFYAMYLIKNHDKIDLYVDFEKGFSKNTKGTYAECCDEGTDTDYTITLDADLGKRSALLALAHEMVHVKQYFKKELNFLERKRVHRFNKVDYPENMYYFERPWEIEAFGREFGLYRMFQDFEKRKAKEKKLKAKKKNVKK
jgi:hypothetical protein